MKRSLPPSPSEDEVVTVSYNDLVTACGGGKSKSRSDHSDTSPSSPTTPTTVDNLIGRAFGSSTSSLGIIAITDVPNLDRIRRTLLPFGRDVSNLPPGELERITVPESYYTVGWSHGREKVEGDKFDTSKGSFYANPLTDDALVDILDRRARFRTTTTTLAKEGGGEGEAETVGQECEWDAETRNVDEEELRKVAVDNPAFFAPNVWPTESLPGVEDAFKEAGRLVQSVGTMVARRCDAYVSARCPGYQPGKLESIVAHSKCCKARLLHYFAMENSNNNKNDGKGDDRNSDCDTDIKEDGDFSNWCGWHNDHGSLTGLIPALYLDANGKVAECPDTSAGLYVKSRAGRIVRAALPADATGGGKGDLGLGTLLFQVGETAQVHTGGWLQATPHAVKGCSVGGMGMTRETFAVFMEPEYHSDMDIPEGRTVEDAQSSEGEQHLPKAVRTLRSRWKPGMNFGEFSAATFAAFH